MNMEICLLFHGLLEADYPEAHECMRIRDEAHKRGVKVTVLKPKGIDLQVDYTDEWRAIYEGKELDRPDVIVPRTGSETTYAGYSVMRFFERLGVPFLNTPRVV